jgi:signal peptidase II
MDDSGGDTRTGRKFPANRLIAFLLIVAVGVSVDLGTKSWIFARLGMPQPWEGPEQRIAILPPVFTLTTSLNEGALFGFGRGLVWGFAGLSLVAGVFIVWWLFIAGAAKDWLVTTALSLVMAGICGNLYDRLGMPGLSWIWPQQRAGQHVYAVRDWLHFDFRSWGLFDYPVFNIADSMLVVGAGLLFLHVWLFRAPHSDARKSKQDGSLASNVNSAD